MDLLQKHSWFKYKDWMKSNGNSSIFLTWLYSQGHNIYVSSIQLPPLFITFCQMFGRHHTPSAPPSLFMFHIDCPITRISSSLIVGMVVDLGFTTLLTSQVISIGFYSECEKSRQISLRGSNFSLRLFYVP